MRSIRSLLPALFLAAAIISDAEEIPAPEPASEPSAAPENNRFFDELSNSAVYPVGYFALEGADLDTEVTSPGYDGTTRELYETLPDAELSARLGYGFLGLPCKHPWRRTFRPDPLPRRNLQQLSRMAGSGLPLVCDLTISEGSHARMQILSGVRPHDEFWPVPESGSIQFSVTSQKARDFWIELWQEDATDFQKTFSAAPQAYRLFAKARLQDNSSWFRSNILKSLRTRYENISKFNQLAKPAKPFTSFSALIRFRDETNSIPVFVEHSRYLEESFAAMIDQAALVFAPVPVYFQTAQFNAPGIDPATAFRACPILCAPADAGGNPLLTALYYRAIAKGRPVLSPEISPSNDAEATCRQFLAQLARGYAATMLAPVRRNPRAWLRYGRNPKTRKTGIDAQRSREEALRFAQCQPQNYLNPFLVAPSNLVAGLTLAREQLQKLAPYFKNPEARPEASVAILYSHASARLQQIAPTDAVSASEYVKLCHFSFLPAELLLEQDLAEGNSIPASYKALIVPESIEAALPGTVEKLSSWVREGGTLITHATSLCKNEWGSTLSKTSPFLSGNTTNLTENGGIAKVPMGKGTIYCITEKKTPPECIKEVPALLNSAGCKPVLSCTKTQGPDKAPVRGIEWAAGCAPKSPHNPAFLLFNRNSETLTFDVSIPGRTDEFPPVRVTLKPQASYFLVF